MLTKGMNMDIWVVSTSNQLFLRGSETERAMALHFFQNNDFFMRMKFIYFYIFVNQSEHALLTFD